MEYLNGLWSHTGARTAIFLTGMPSEAKNRIDASKLGPSEPKLPYQGYPSLPSDGRRQLRGRAGPNWLGIESGTARNVMLRILGLK